jgi:hypothetical protein
MKALFQTRYFRLHWKYGPGSKRRYCVVGRDGTQIGDVRFMARYGDGKFVFVPSKRRGCDAETLRQLTAIVAHCESLAARSTGERQ